MNKWVKRALLVLGLMVFLILAGGLLITWKISAFVERAGFVETWSQADGTVYEDLVYNEKANLRYDLFIPAGASKARSHGLCLFIHGGSWNTGSRKDMHYAARRYAKAGYISATVSYSLVSKERPTTMYQMLDDIGSAIRAVKAKTSELGFTVDKLALSGYSAGGHLSMLYAYSRAQESAIPVVLLFQQSGPTDFHPDTRGGKESDTGLISAATGKMVTAAMLENGEAEALVRSISPTAFVNETTVPSVVGYGLKDTLVRPRHAEKLVEAFKMYGVPYTLVEYPNSGHVLGSDPASREKYEQVSLEYLRRAFGY